MDKLDKFIIDISKRIENLNQEMDWEYFESKYNFNITRRYSSELDDFIFVSSIEWIINNAFNENPINAIKMLEYICYKYGITFDFTEIKEEVKLSNKEVNITFPKEALNDKRVFISYSHHNLKEAEKIYNIFLNEDMDCFLASEDIKIGETWDEKIFEELVKADIFIIMVSKEYKESFWCNQEVSIGYLKREFNNSLVIPIIIDDTTPYGIFYNIQGVPYSHINSINDFIDIINPEGVSFDNAVNKFHNGKLKEIDNIIKELKDSNYFNLSNKLLRMLKFKNLDVHRVERIMDYALSNNQILYSWEFENFIKKYIKKYNAELDQNKLEKIKGLLNLYYEVDYND